ncbi:hypothetical protein HYH03_013645 [Edaphochlamys debaryana]|uniref:Uncharacterized protein n=1 Tax=Edaphochlamys debaryana TaxID=47281 RepID=A0A835XPS4_9CHLO|nr:hypothetical protein HYH03_013645 [Edaphochlamys debaryana]|eukprot:KAG2487801.1 hypothetical protein HYH03_013645 [Edaphochlamys debaryana]
MAGKEATASSVRQLPTTAEAEKVCNTNVTCTGFDSDGYVLFGTISKWSDAAMCSYAKIACPARPNYVVTEFYGIISRAPSGQTTPDKAEAACNADPTCQSWNNAGKFIKGPAESWVPVAGMCTYRKNATCPTKPGYITKVGLNWARTAPGGWMPYVDAESFCNTNASCTAFNQFGYYILGPITGWTPYSDMCSYQKITCPPKPNYVATAFAGIISRAPFSQVAAATAEAACNADRKCQSWNTAGTIIKGPASDWINVPGMCTYRKTGENLGQERG